MRVVALVPVRRGEPVRDAIWEHCRGRLTRDLDLEVFEGTHEAGPFNRSLAVNQAAELAGTWDVAAIVDADVIIDPRAFQTAVRVAADAGVFVIAGDRRVNLTAQGTSRVMEGFTGNWERPGFVEQVFAEHWSSCVVVRRDLWEKVRGFDPLFSGWGYEDDAFRCACETMSGAGGVKISSTIWHLSHPRQASPADQRAKNKARALRYWDGLGDEDAIKALIAEREELPELGPARVPRILHRTGTAEILRLNDAYWRRFAALHPGWELRSWEEPLQASDFPMIHRHLNRCQNGAQRAGLVRLEALLTHGGVYVDADVEPLRSLEPLLQLSAFAAWEDETTVPDAVLGAEPDHPAIKVLLERALDAVTRGADAWESGPGGTTAVLPGRSDVLILPPGAFYPHHYLTKNQADETPGPWAFARHHWDGSWLDAQQRASIEANQRA